MDIGIFLVLQQSGFFIFFKKTMTIPGIEKIPMQTVAAQVTFILLGSADAGDTLFRSLS